GVAYFSRSRPHQDMIGPIRNVLVEALFVLCVIPCSAQPNSWTQKNALGYAQLNAIEPSGRLWPMGFAINGKVYLGTGASESGYTRDVWEYDPTLNTWAQKADFGGVAR